MAYKHAGFEEYRKATQCGFWCVKASNESHYDLACWESLAGNVDAAMFWLQESGQIAGVDSRWSRKDPDLDNVRNDARWPSLLNYLVACERYWRVHGPKLTTLIVPEAYDRRTELTLVVWLHGMGGAPDFHKSEFQSIANKHQIGFVGVSGTVPTGKTRFAWADVADEDYERVSKALTEAQKAIRWRDGNVIALGFSQGAMVGLEIAARHPEVFAGAITISAGTGSPVQLDEVRDKSQLPHQGFVIVCGAKENKWSVERSNDLVSWLKSGNAKVLQPPYPNHATHSFPADFEKRLPEWVQFVERARSK